MSEPRTEGLSTVGKPGVGPGRTEPPLSAETASARADAVVPPAGLHTREVCETVGPFPQRGLADAFIALLPPVMATDGMREERVPKPTRHWALAPVQPSKEAASAYLAALQAAGIKDAWRAQSGVFTGRLVVGVFSTEENARRHAAMLAGKGVATEIRKQQAEEVRWWVDLRRGSEDGRTLDVPEGLQVTPRECGRVAAP